MIKTAFTCISVIFLIFHTEHTFANVTFSINVSQIQEPNPSLRRIEPINERTISKDQISKKKRVTVFDVEIGQDFFSYESDKAKYIYDLDNNKRITINLTNNTFVDDSLFAAVMYKINEFQNRLMLGQTLTAGGSIDNPMALVFIEHLFSLRHPNKNSGLTSTSTDEVVSYSWEGKELLSYSKEGALVSHQEKEMFIKFFRYVYKGHPQILDQLSSDNIIPYTIQISQYHTSITKNKLTISSIQTTHSESYSLDGYLPGELPDKVKPNFRFLYDLKTSKEIMLQQHLDHLLQRANEEFENGKYLDTFLFYLEYSLCSGLQLPSIFQKHFHKIKEDENIGKLQTAISSINSETTEKLLLDFKKLELASKFQMHVIKIFEANTQTILGNHKEAKELFFEALDSSPYITGVYMDLGDIYFKERNPGMAWLCWDVARKINPSHKMVSRVEEFELKLIESYPKFF